MQSGPHRAVSIHVDGVVPYGLEHSVDVGQASCADMPVREGGRG